MAEGTLHLWVRLITYPSRFREKYSADLYVCLPPSTFRLYQLSKKIAIPSFVEKR